MQVNVCKYMRQTKVYVNMNGVYLTINCERSNKMSEMSYLKEY